MSENILVKSNPLESLEDPIRVAVVSDRNSYALQLTRAIAAIPNIVCLFYGPKRPPIGRVIQFGGFKNEKDVWTTYRYFLQIFAQALRDRPHIVHFDFTLTIFGNTYLSCVPLGPLVILLRLFGYKVIITVHDTITRDVLSELFGQRQIIRNVVWLTSVAFYKFLSLADALIVHLEIQEQKLARWCYIDRKKIHVAPFGVEDSPFTSKSLQNHWRERFCDKVVLFFGNIAPRKGIEYLIEGFSLIAKDHLDSCLVIAGRADSRNRKYLDYLLKTASNSLGNMSFFYLGYLPEDKAHALLDLSEVVVLPYVYAHASPSILYWAIQHNKPVIASRIGTLSEELRGYPEKLLVRAQDSRQIAGALEEILTNAQVIADATHFMASKASLLSWSRTRDNIREVYFSVL